MSRYGYDESPTFAGTGAGMVRPALTEDPPSFILIPTGPTLAEVLASQEIWHHPDAVSIGRREDLEALRGRLAGSAAGYGKFLAGVRDPDQERIAYLGIFGVEEGMQGLLDRYWGQVCATLAADSGLHFAIAMHRLAGTRILVAEEPRVTDGRLEPPLAFAALDPAGAVRIPDGSISLGSWKSMLEVRHGEVHVGQLDEASLRATLDLFGADDLVARNIRLDPPLLDAIMRAAEHVGLAEALRVEAEAVRLAMLDRAAIGDEDFPWDPELDGADDTPSP